MSRLRTIRSQALYWWAITHRYFGEEHHIKREFERAAYYFGRAYDIDPTFHQARLAKAVMLGRELGQVTEALSELDQMLLEDESYSDARLNRAQLRQEVGDYRGALADWERYLEAPADNYKDLAEKTAKYLQELLSNL